MTSGQDFQQFIFRFDQLLSHRGKWFIEPQGGAGGTAGYASLVQLERSARQLVDHDFGAFVIAALRLIEHHRAVGRNCLLEQAITSWADWHVTVRSPAVCVK